MGFQMYIDDIVREKYVEELAHYKQNMDEYKNSDDLLGHQIYIMSYQTYQFVMEKSPLKIKEGEVQKYINKT